MSTLELKTYEIFKIKLGESEASTVMNWVVETTTKEIADKKDIFLTKDDKVQIIEKIADVKSEMIKWMFIFWIGTVGTLAGIMFVLLHIGK
jgi:hypothetical protein